MEFVVYFNGKKQWIEVTLWEVHPNTFERWGSGRWGYWQATWTNPKSGKFGEMHFVQSRIRFDTIAHEVFHAVMEWAWANRSFTPYTEERLAEMTDRLCRGIVKNIRKIYPKIVL